MRLITSKYSRFFFNSICLLVLYFLFSGYVIIKTGLNPKIQESDLIVVLGTQVKDTGELTRLLKWRLDTTHQLYSAGISDLIIVSGGKGDNEYEEAEIMQEYLLELGIPKEHIVLDFQGYDTYSSVKNTVTYMEDNYDSVMFVSDYTHIFRTKTTFHKFDIDNVNYTFSDVPMLSDWTVLIRETLAVVAYQFRDYHINNASKN